MELPNVVRKLTSSMLLQTSLMIPNKIKKTPKIASIFVTISGTIFGRILKPLGEDSGTQNSIKFSMIFQCDFGGLLGTMTEARREPKLHYFGAYFFHEFWRPFGLRFGG